MAFSPIPAQVSSAMITVYFNANPINTVSPFDEKLTEDKRVNRLEDCYLLWRSVCANKMLARTQLILCKSSTYPFPVKSSNSRHAVLNKCDLLQAKLQRGIRIRDSVPSFGDRKNDLSTATKCNVQSPSPLR